MRPKLSGLTSLFHLKLTYCNKSVICAGYHLAILYNAHTEL